jgi:hypothetical protein
VKDTDHIDFLYTNIGRGHPFYLDGLREQRRQSQRSGPQLEVSDVFAHSKGLSQMAWRAARWLYGRGSSGGASGLLYSRLRRRSDHNGATLGLKLLGRDLRRRRWGISDWLVVAHPILVGIFKGRPGLIYQHGELVAPDEALVTGAAWVLVPTPEVARRFIEAGYDSAQVIVTGLCLERALTAGADDDYLKRQMRLKSDAPLTGLFLSSGAEPKPHVAQIMAGLSSVVEAGTRADVLVRRDGRLHRELISTDLSNAIRIHVFSDRHQETEISTVLVPKADYLVAPAHERTNWAVGLGLPIFVLTPTIGSFAPLNLALIESHGVGEAVGDMAAAGGLGARLIELHRAGELARRSEQGWGRYELGGFARGADFLAGLKAID